MHTFTRALKDFIWIREPETYEESKKRGNREYAIFAASTMVLTSAFCAACMYYLPAKDPHIHTNGLHSAPCVTQAPQVDNKIRRHISNQL
jgi:hypothetical protein